MELSRFHEPTGCCGAWELMFYPETDVMGCLLKLIVTGVVAELRVSCPFQKKKEVNSFRFLQKPNIARRYMGWQLPWAEDSKC